MMAGINAAPDDSGREPVIMQSSQAYFGIRSMI